MKLQDKVAGIGLEQFAQHLEPGRTDAEMVGIVEAAIVSEGTRLPGVSRVRAFAQQLEWYEVVRAAQQAAIKMCRAGVPCAEVDRAARSVIKQQGLSKYFLHITGHGVGWRYHEPVPFVAPGNPEPLRDGYVHSVEPGLYQEGFGGMRVEDNVAEQAGTCRVLSSADRSLI